MTAALAQGRGLATLAIQTSESGRYSDALLAACVENLQFDRQCEANRGPYIMRLLELADLRDRAREKIFASLPHCEAGWDRDWMVDLLEALATEGDRVSWNALRDLAAGGNKRAQDNLATTDEEGLAWVAEHVLPTLPEDDRWRICMWLPDESADDVTSLQRRLRALDEERLKSIAATREAHPKRRRKAEGFLRSLERGTSSSIDANDFAQKATPYQWRAAARRFLRERRSRPLRALARAFKRRDFPLSVGHLFRQATHPDRGWVVMQVLGTFDTPVVRRFALGLLRRRPLPWNATDAIQASLRPGDEPLVLDALCSVAGEDNMTRHSPILDVVALMDEYRDFDWQAHAEWIVEHSPCSMCRGSAFDWLVERGAVPAWFLAEAPYDAEPDIRKAAAER